MFYRPLCRLFHLGCGAGLTGTEPGQESCPPYPGNMFFETVGYFLGTQRVILIRLYKIKITSSL
jgi:hypothetical protein